MKITNFKWEEDLNYSFTIGSLPVTRNGNQIIEALPSKMIVREKGITLESSYDEIMEGISLHLDLF